MSLTTQDGDEVGTFALPKHSVVEFTGSDWKEWLQGQITQDIKLLEPNKPVGFCMCKPTGQLLSFGDLHEIEGRGWMVVPTVSVDDVLARVESMVIMEDCFAKLLDVNLFHSTKLAGDLPSNRIGVNGFDLLGYEGELSSGEVFDYLRLFANQPEFGKDTNEKTLPPEMGLDFEKRYIHYSKGCYTGQEVLQRIHSRGHINRTWTVLESKSPDPDGIVVTSQAKGPDELWLIATFLREDAQLPDGVQVHIGSTPAIIEQ